MDESAASIEALGSLRWNTIVLLSVASTETTGAAEFTAVDQVLTGAAGLSKTVPGEEGILRIQVTAAKLVRRHARVLTNLYRQRQVVRRKLPRLRQSALCLPSVC